MRHFVTAIGLLLAGCNSSSSSAVGHSTKEVEEQKRAIWNKLSSAEEAYFECAQEQGLRVGSRDALTTRQAEAATDACGALLGSAALGRQNRAMAIDSLDQKAYGPSPKSQFQITAGYLTTVSGTLKIEAIRRISKAVPPPAEM